MTLRQNIKILSEGGVVVMPTDTLYGIVGKAFSPLTVSRIYEARKRTPEKPFIVLIGDVSELNKFSINLSEEQKKVVENFTTPTSFILDCPHEELTYLHRGTKTLGFRVPAEPGLRNLLLKTGPLVAPSANPEGLPPAKNITEAKNYFGDLVDLYIDGGEIEGKASKVIRLERDGTVAVLRD